MTGIDTTAALPLMDNQAEAKATYALVGACITQLTLTKFPQPTLKNFGDDEDPDWALVCPWCGDRMSSEDGIIEVDVSIRHNEGEINVTAVPNFGEGDVIISQADSNFDTMCFVSGCCDTPIDLPEGWDSTWV